MNFSNFCEKKMADWSCLSSKSQMISSRVTDFVQFNRPGVGRHIGWNNFVFIDRLSPTFVQPAACLITQRDNRVSIVVRASFLTRLVTTPWNFELHSTTGHFIVPRGVNLRFTRTRHVSLLVDPSLRLTIETILSKFY